jgi:hypothetical protein
LIVGCHDHTSSASLLGVGADYHWKSTERRVIALLDGRVEGVHIDMNDDAHQIAVLIAPFTSLTISIHDRADESANTCLS